MKLFNFKKKKEEEDKSIKIIHLDSVDSTNDYLRKYTPEEGEKITIVVADYQTAGRGQGTNTWESEAGKNLLFSILVHPVMVPIRQQFLLSMAGAIALKMALSTYTDDISLKWPNDVYWKDKKISGTLIENSISAGHIQNCIFGVGINVNQEKFISDAPNPVSLYQILGHEVDIEELLQVVIKCFKKCYSLIEDGDYIDIDALYHDSLYRKHGFFKYRDNEGEFEAAIVEVQDNGHIILRNREGVMSEYAFKEIEFVI